MRRALLAAVALLFLTPHGVFAGGFTQTLPEGTFLLEGSFVTAWIDTRWDDDGKAGPLIDAMERYEPGGGKQGTIIPEPDAQYLIWVTRLQYGIVDGFSFGIGIPVVIRSTVDPHLGWEEGDYMPQLGRPYSEHDFWQWADSMGQRKPRSWTGNEGVLGDIVLGFRLRWTEWLPALEKAGLSMALSFFWDVPTGSHADPEEIAAVGTTMWELHFQGDFSIHLSFDQSFTNLDDRFSVGLDLFYDVFVPRERDTPTGSKHPLLLTQSPYVGSTYEVDPGDFAGISLRFEGVPYVGPAWDTWLTKGDPEKAAAMPPILALSFMYTFTHVQQSDWSSDYPAWDWDREKMWLPGYKNQLQFSAVFSFLRLGAPLNLYIQYRTATLMPGKNTRAADVITAGLQIPLKFW